MNAAVIFVIFGGLLAISSADAWADAYHNHGFYHGGVYPYHGFHGYHGHGAHPVAVPVHYETYPYIRDASGNTVPFGGHTGDENLDGIPDVQDTNRDAKKDPADHYDGYNVLYAYHKK